MVKSIKLSEEVDPEEFRQNVIKARKNKNLSIKDASQILNISEDIIYKFEKGDFKTTEKDVFIVGHIKTYLNLIEIDPKLLINNYKSNKNTQKKSNRNIILPYNFILSKDYILLISIILFFLILLIYKETKTLNKKHMFNAYNKEFINSEKSEKEINEISEQEKNIPKLENTKNKVDKESIIDEIKTKNNDKIISEIKETDFIYIQASEESWVEIQDKNSEVIVSKIFNKNEKIKLSYQKDLLLVTGNAGGIIIKINNNIINNIGKPGEVKRNISLNIENLIKFIDK